jgi:molybdate transport system substrate-binding protein
LRSRAHALLLALALPAWSACAAEARIAVAANFVEPARELAERASRATGHALALSAGSTGKFYAQIRSGAPFDVLLSADDSTPARLEQDRLAVAATRRTYAIGRLALWSPKPGLVDERGEVLRRAPFARLAIANPRLAPYGAAAKQAMEKLGVWHALQEKLVQGENIGQTYQFVASGNAELAFVALSQLERPGQRAAGSRWLVPPALHAPLRQDAVLLAHGERNAAARAFLEYLESAAARELIRAYGYALP